MAPGADLTPDTVPVSNHLEMLRATELEDALRLMAPPGDLLEIGAGSGWQARELAERGFTVHAVDVSDDAHIGRYHPVARYDGVHLPVADDSIDVIFSSNVLEHVRDLDALLSDCARVLKPGGHMVHLMPSVSWRLWTSVAHYGFLLKALGRGGGGRDAAGIEVSAAATLRRRGIVHLLGRVAVAGPHGEFPSALHELYAFGRRRWQRRFETTGWRVRSARPSSLFYTGYGLCPSLPRARREALAGQLGGACNVFDVVRAR